MEPLRGSLRAPTPAVPGPARRSPKSYPFADSKVNLPALVFPVPRLVHPQAALRCYTYLPRQSDF
jgi:hypothetical protein